MLRSPVLAVLLAALAPEGCELDLFSEDFRYAEQQHHLLPDAQHDSLRYVEVYTAISSTGLSSVAALEAFVQRRRVYPPEGGFLHVDLDDPMDEDDFDPDDPREARLGALLARLPACVQVEDAGLCLDARGELCAWRITRIHPLAEVLAALDWLVSMTLLEQFDRAREDGGQAFPWQEPESIELARRRAEAGGPWVRLVEGRLTLDVPLSPRGAARALERVAARGEDPPLPPWFCSQVASLTADQERILAALGSASDPAIHFHPPVAELREGPDVELIDAVREAGLALDGPHALDRALARLHDD